MPDYLQSRTSPGTAQQTELSPQGSKEARIFKTVALLRAKRCQQQQARPPGDGPPPIPRQGLLWFQPGEAPPRVMIAQKDLSGRVLGLSLTAEVRELSGAVWSDLGDVIAQIVRPPRHRDYSKRSLGNPFETTNPSPMALGLERKPLRHRALPPEASNSLSAQGKTFAFMSVAKASVPQGKRGQDDTGHLNDPDRSVKCREAQSEGRPFS